MAPASIWSFQYYVHFVMKQHVHPRRIFINIWRFSNCSSDDFIITTVTKINPIISCHVDHSHQPTGAAMSLATPATTWRATSSVTWRATSSATWRSTSLATCQRQVNCHVGVPRQLSTWQTVSQRLTNGKYWQNDGYSNDENKSSYIRNISMTAVVSS